MKKHCGPGKSAFLIPDFIFTSSCLKHDNYYKKGGGIIEKVMADTFFYAYMLEDISKAGYSFSRRMFYFLMATLYFIFVMTVGCIWWKWKFEKLHITYRK